MQRVPIEILEASKSFTFRERRNGEDGLLEPPVGHLGAVGLIRSVGAVVVAVALPRLEDALAIGAAELPVLALARLAVLLVLAIRAVARKDMNVGLEMWVTISCGIREDANSRPCNQNLSKSFFEDHCFTCIAIIF